MKFPHAGYMKIDAGISSTTDLFQLLNFHYKDKDKFSVWETSWIAYRIHGLSFYNEGNEGM